VSNRPEDTHEPVFVPREQLPISFFDTAVLAVRRDDGQIYLSIRDMCEALELALSAQRRRIVSTDTLVVALARFRVHTAGGRQVVEFLELDMVPIWLMGVQPRRTSEAVRQKLMHVQNYLIRSVQAAFAHLTGLPDAPSGQIEDLHDLDRIDSAFRHLSELSDRQSTLEQSQDRARHAWKDMADRIRILTDRVQQLEHAAQNRLSPLQRNTIYRLVQAWGNARAARDSKLTSGTAIRACWAILNARFKVATYTDISAAQYDACCSYIQLMYTQLTGEQLNIVEQEGLDL
jgi:hypothetical protein